MTNEDAVIKLKDMLKRSLTCWHGMQLNELFLKYYLLK